MTMDNGLLNLRTVPTLSPSGRLTTTLGKRYLADMGCQEREASGSASIAVER